MLTCRTSRLVLAAILAVTLIRVLFLALASPNLSFDEAQYWAWSQTFQLGYFSKPPMVAWAIAATTGLFGDSEGMVKLGSTLAHGGVSLFVFLLGRALISPRIGMWAALGWLTMPAVSLSSLMISTDPFLLLFWSLALWALVRATQTGPAINGWWGLLGVALGLGLLSKYAMIFFVLCLAVWMAWDRSARQWLRAPGLWLSLILGGLIYAPNALWNASNGFVSYAHTKANANLGGSLFHPDKMAEFLVSQMGVFGPILLIGLLIAIIRGVRPSTSDGNSRFLLSFSLPILLIMLVESLLSRSNANWTAPAFVTATVLVAALWADQRPLWLKTSLALHVAVGCLLLSWEPLRPLLPGSLSTRLDLSKRIRGWDQVGQRVSHILAQNPDHRLLSDERKLMANLTYYVRPHPFDAIKWNPDGRIHDYFDQTTRLVPGPQDYIYVTERTTAAAEITSRFERAEQIEIISQTLNPSYRRTVTVWRVGGFRGYAP